MSLRSLLLSLLLGSVFEASLARADAADAGARFTDSTDAQVHSADAGSMSPADAADEQLLPRPHEHGHVAGHAHSHAHVVVHEHAHGHAQEPAYGALARAHRAERAASSRIIEGRALLRAPNLQSSDLLRLVPGLHVIQHAGGGKANQYFLRGFDVDHGTDLALSVDGVPVNMVSHGHGQGYADANWLIPELVQRIEVHKGPYDPRAGDFATAGAIDMQTGALAPESRLTLQGGMFHSYRALGVVGSEIDQLSLSGAAEVYGTDGPFDSAQNLQRYNLFARLAHPLAGGQLSLTTTAYGSGWDASGQIPLRAVRSGALDRFGAVDPREGGHSTRHSVYARYKTQPQLAQRWELLGYLVRYRFALYSNFTFFSADPVNGDMIQQHDQRTLSGFKMRYSRDDRLGRLTLSSRAGVELRHDAIENGLERAPDRELSQTLVATQIDQTAIGLFFEEEVEWTSWLRTALAIRGDWFDFAVRDTLEERASLGTSTSGDRARMRVSPKGTLAVTPLPWLELYGNFGYGFHSNDARGVVRGVTPLTRALGYEAGLRARAKRLLSAQLALFRLDLDSELVWVGDEGTTEASGRTRRDGIELDLNARPLEWLSLDLSVALTRARFRAAPAGEDAVPLAPRRMLSGSVSLLHPRGTFARLMILHVGDRPATEDGALVADGFTRADLSGGYRQGRFELALRLENLLNARWRESQFATVSRLPGENDASACPVGTRGVAEGGRFLGCEDVNFTPGWPFTAHASATVYF